MEQDVLPYISSEELNKLLLQMRAEIASNPRANIYTKSSPEVSTDEIHTLTSRFLIRYLRAMKYDVKKAVDLWIRSLEFRTNVVGIPPWKKGFELKEFENILKDGFVTVAKGLHDSKGRQVIVVRPRLLNPYLYDKTKIIQCFWTIWDHILDDESVQLNGAFIFIDAENIGPRNFNFKIQRSIGEAISHRLPLRIGRVLVLNPPTFFNVVWGFVKLILSPKIISRFRVLSGSPVQQSNNKKFVGIQSNVPNISSPLSPSDGPSQKSEAFKSTPNDASQLKEARRERKNREKFDRLIHIFKGELGVVNITRREARHKEVMLVGGLDSADDTQMPDDNEIVEFRLWPVEYDGDFKIPWGSWWDRWTE